MTQRGDVRLMDTDLAEMMISVSETLVVASPNTPRAIDRFVTGLLDGWTFTPGFSGIITAEVDLGAGETELDQLGHSLATGDFITILDSANYNGVHEVTKLNADAFKITQGFVADEGSISYQMGSYLEVEPGREGIYSVDWSMSMNEATPAKGTIIATVYHDANLSDSATNCRKFANNDIGPLSGGGLISIAEGERVWIALESDLTNDCILRFMNVKLARK